MAHRAKNNRMSIRQIGKLVRQAFTCPHCGGSIMVYATKHKGHGTGQHGSAYYRATAVEQVTPEKHCTCPGGPMWDTIIKSELGTGLKLAEAQERYPDLEDGQVPFWNPEIDEFCSTDARTWRKVVQETFEGLNSN